jgi:ABC-type branched-subunit amino acid transport system substrate-binding protein
MKKVFLALFVVISIIGVAISGYTATSQKVLKIGASFALNNPMGLEPKKWLVLFAKLINDKGGWQIGKENYKVDMIVYDNQGDAVKAKTDLEKLVLEDGVKFILGDPTGSPGVTTTVTEPNKVICLGLDVTNVSADPKIQYYWTPNGMFFARGLMYTMYKEMVNKGIKSYVSVKPDTEFGHWADKLCNSTWDFIGKGKLKFLGSVFYAADTTDYAPVATKIKSLNPDLIDCNYTTTALQLFIALYNAGFKGIILPAQVDPDLFQNIIKTCGKKFMEGWQYFYQDPRGYQKDPEILALIDAYTKEYGEFRTGGCMWVAYWFILKDAIEHTQSVDVETIKAYLDRSDHAVKTLTGYCQLFARPDTGNLRTVSGEPADYVAVVKDGKEIPYRNIAVKDHYLASILSYGLTDVYKKYWEKYGYPKFPKEPYVMKFSDLGIKGHD